MESQPFFPVPVRPRGERRSAREMFPLVEQWLESSERQIDFCQRHGLKVAVLGYWLKKYRTANDPEQASCGFVPVKVRPAPEQPIEISYPNGVTIRAGGGVSAKFLRELAGQC